MSLALTVQMKVLTAVVEGLQSVEKEPRSGFMQTRCCR